MKESVGYTVSLNIVIVFITIVVAFLCAALIYFKSNKASNIITSAIEKYEGYNLSSINEINRNLVGLGYNKHQIDCADTVTDRKNDEVLTCTRVEPISAGITEDPGVNGYCVYQCVESAEYFYYKIRTNMMLTIPIISDIMDIPIYSNTNRLYNFEKEDEM